MLTGLEYLRGTKTWEQRKLGELVEFYNGDRSSRYPNDSDKEFHLLMQEIWFRDV